MVLDPLRLDGVDADRGLPAADLASDLRRVVRAAAHASEGSNAACMTRDGPSFTVTRGFGPDLLAHAALLGSTVLARALRAGGAAAPAGDDGPFGFLLTELLHAAFHDPLTGLHNRASFMERLGAAFAESRRRPGRPFAVLFLDLDRFKLVNDGLGHRAGDLLLSQVACRLEGCLRPGDTLARFGGDEFACLVEDADGAAGGTEVAARFIEALRAPLRVLGHDVVCSCSIGVVRSAARYGQPGDLLRDADAAMYRAKNGGPGTFAVFADDVPAGGLRAPDLGTELPRAIERNELRLDYQPLLDPARGRVTGVEALVRWQHPRLSLMPPAAFVPLAEGMGLVVPLGAWVLGQACQQVRNWHDRFPGRPPLRVGVNVSGRELADPGYLFRLTAALDRTGLDPRCLELEIAESVFLHQAGTVGPVLERVRALGVRIALDGFGPGHPSLASLDRFPVDTLKIGRSFVAGMLARDRALAIVEAVVRLGGRLGLDVVAEGVETAAQFNALARMGCAQVQGFHLARPGPACGIAARLSRGASSPPGVGAAAAHPGPEPRMKLAIDDISCK